MSNSTDAHRPISVLYIHHSGVFGGASRSLLELIRAFPDGEIKAHLITQHGKVPEIFRQHGVEVIETAGISQLDHTRYSYYHGIRWLLLGRELLYLPFTIMAMMKARRQWPDIELVHINEVTNALAIMLAKLIFRGPLIVHIRSVQQRRQGSLRIRLVEWLLKKADARIAIDSTVRNFLPQEIPVHTIHNGFKRDVGGVVPKSYAKDAFAERPMTICFVGGLLVMKGLQELVQAAKLCVDAGLNVHFLVVGETPRNRHGLKSLLLNKLGISFDVTSFCTDYIHEHQLHEVVEFRGFTLDIEAVYRQADVLCFPSHLNAIGRPVIEAAHFAVPSIVAIREEADDTIRHHQTGLMIREVDVQGLFEAVEYFYHNPAEITRMGAASLKLAEQNFDITSNAGRVLEVYRDLLVCKRKS